MKFMLWTYVYEIFGRMKKNKTFWIHNYYVIEMNNHKIDGLEQSVFYLVSEPILANLILQGSLQYRISQDSGRGIGKKWEAV